MKHQGRRALIASILFAATSAVAQNYPSKPVRLFNQFGAGTPGDVLVRVVANNLQPFLGQPVIVEARPGGGGIAVTASMVRAEPDGYTLVALIPNVPVVNVVLAKTPPPFDPDKDLTPITMVAKITTMAVAAPSFPANNLTELIEYARRNPGKVSYGTTGVGSYHHLALELIKSVSGVNIVHVPYKTNPAIDAAAGVIEVASVIAPIAAPMIRAGKLKGLYQFGTASGRDPLAPDVASVSELLPGFENPPEWTALFAPAKMPAAVLSRIHADAVKAVTSPNGRAEINKLGFNPATNASPQDFSAQIRREIALITRIVKDAGIPQTD